MHTLTDRVVLDTNSLLSSLSRRGSAYPVWKGFQEGRYTLCVTNEILEEYEEVIARKTRPEIARNVIDFIMQQMNVELIDPYFRMELITAAPDDKGGAARLPSVSWRVPVRGLCFRRQRDLHRAGRLALRRAARPCLPTDSRPEATSVH